MGKTARVDVNCNYIKLYEGNTVSEDLKWSVVVVGGGGKRVV
jgi:hypothetical protein